MSQKPRVPNSIVFSWAKRPKENSAAKMDMAIIMIQYLRAAVADWKAPTWRESFFIGPATAARSLFATSRPHNQTNEDDGSDDSQNNRHWHFKWGNNHAAQQVTDGDDGDAEQQDPRQVGAQVVTAEHADDIGNNQAQKWQGANDHGDHTSGDGHQCGSQQ